MAGEYELIYYVTDSDLTVYDTTNIIINDVNRKPEFSIELPDTTIRNDEEFQFEFAAEDPDEDELTFGIEDSIAGLTLSENGLLTWTLGRNPQDQYNLSIYVSDGTDTVTTTAIIEVEDVVSVSRIGLAIPDQYSLSHNYPNPFNPTTTIEFGLPERAKVKVSIYDLNGNLIETVLNKHKEAGFHRAVWHATGLPTGVYFYRIQTSNFTDVKKCILMK